MEEKNEDISGGITPENTTEATVTPKARKPRASKSTNVVEPVVEVPTTEENQEIEITEEVSLEEIFAPIKKNKKKKKSKKKEKEKEKAKKAKAKEKAKAKAKKAKKAKKDKAKKAKLKAKAKEKKAKAKAKKAKKNKSKKK